MKLFQTGQTPFSRRLKKAQWRVARRQAIEAIILQATGPCYCDTAYRARKKLDPSCVYHQVDPWDTTDDIIKMLDEMETP